MSDVFEKFFLPFVNYRFHTLHRKVKLFGKLLIQNAVTKSALQDFPVTLIVDIFIYQIGYLAVRILFQTNHLQKPRFSEALFSCLFLVPVFDSSGTLAHIALHITGIAARLSFTGFRCSLYYLPRHNNLLQQSYYCRRFP